MDDFVGELLARIQPAPASELRRKSVAEYVQNVISRAFQPGFEASFRFPVDNICGFLFPGSVQGLKLIEFRKEKDRVLECDKEGSQFGLS